MATNSSKHSEPEEAQLDDKKVEIERKFAVTSDAGDRILQAGGKCVKESTFEDVYFDTDSYQLTLADHWLRKRDGCWELKAAVHQDKLNETCTKYAEYESENEILSRLDAIFDNNTEAESDQARDMEEYIKQCNLQPFATFKTTRTCYQMEDDHDVSVVLDSTDFGFNVGEIEIMASQSKTDDAVDRLEQLSKRLGQLLSVF